MALISLRTALPGLVLADNPLLLRLGDGVNSIMPQAGLHPPLKAPWIWFKFDPETPMDPDAIVRSLVFSAWIYGNPGDMYYDIDYVANELLRIYKSGPVEFYDVGGSGWYMGYAGASEDTDDSSGWNQTLRIMRWDVLRS